MLKSITKLFALALVVSCSGPNEPVEAVLSGNISGLESSDVLLIYHDSGRDTLKFDENGNFKWSKALEKDFSARLVLGRNFVPVYLVKDAQINFVASKAEFGTNPQITGKGSAEMALLIKENNLSPKLRALNQLATFGPDSFVQKVDSIMGMKMKWLEESKGSLTPDFEFVFATDAKYENIFYKMNYGYYHNRGKAEEEKEDVSQDVKDAIAQAFVDDSKYAASELYMYYLSSTLREEFYASYDQNQEGAEPLLDYLVFVCKKLNAVELKNEVIHNMAGSMAYVPGESLKAYYDLYMTNQTNESYKALATENYEALSKLTAGNDFVDFEVSDIKGDVFKLADFKGKLLYIDMWATWCGPCKAEIPYLVKLYDEYKDKNIEIVSISIDEDKQAWEKMITEEGYKWKQLFSKGAWESEIIKVNKISGIPRFMLIDQNGKIITVNAPRPSSDKIRQLLDKHIL